MTARQIKRRAMRHMTQQFKSCSWWLFGAPSQRRPGVLVTMGAVTAKPDRWRASEVTK